MMLDRPTIERALALSEGAPIVLALSGGGDSVALLHILATTLGLAKLRAVIVDHALRAGSADDARTAAGFADALGVAAEIVTLTWPDGEKRAQASARHARYAALCDAARRIGARVIAVAHTADDQNETVLMRAGAGSAWRGLAGMARLAPAPIWPQGRGLFIARPLLGVRRQDLRDHLRARGAPWIEDPANANTTFERVRTRQRLAALEEAGTDVMRLSALAARIRPHVDALDRDADELCAAAVEIEGDVISLDPKLWRAAPEAVRLRLLSVLLTAAAGAAREPVPDAVARLAARIADDFRGAALGGAQISPRRGRMLISRDPGALTGRADGASAAPLLSLMPRVEAVWDGRLAIMVDEPGWSIDATSGSPHLRRGAELLPLNEALMSGQSRWLLSQRIRHLLGGLA